MDGGRGDASHRPLYAGATAVRDVAAQTGSGQAQIAVNDVWRLSLFARRRLQRRRMRVAVPDGSELCHRQQHGQPQQPGERGTWWKQGQVGDPGAFQASCRLVQPDEIRGIWHDVLIGYRAMTLAYTGAYRGGLANLNTAISGRCSCAWLLIVRSP